MAAISIKGEKLHIFLVAVAAKELMIFILAFSSSRHSPSDKAFLYFLASQDSRKMQQREKAEIRRDENESKKLKSFN